MLTVATLYGLFLGVPSSSQLPPLTPNAFQAILGESTSSAMILALCSTLVAAGAIAYWIKMDKRPCWVLALASIPCFFLSVPPVLRFSDLSDLLVKDLPGVRPHERVAFVNGPWDLMLAAPALMPPNTASVSRIAELGGYDSLLHRDTVKMLADVDGQDAAPPANGNMMFVKKSANLDKLKEAGVSAVIRQNGDHLDSISTNGPGRASGPNRPAEIVTEDSTQIKFRATGPGKLVLRDRNMPGWLAKVDGRHVPITGGLWREVDLPPGDHTIEMNYVPPGFMIGIFAAIAGWISVAGLLCRPTGDQTCRVKSLNSSSAVFSARISPRAWRSSLLASVGRL